LFRFTIRDVLWLTVVVALGAAWAVDHSRARATLESVRRELLATRVFLRESGGFAEYRNDKWTVGDNRGTYHEFRQDRMP
jgi:hypothetical protein